MKSYEELGKVGIRISNLKESCYGIKIGRPHLLGNPFVVGKDGTREEIIMKYRKWLWKKVEEKGEVWKELKRIEEIWHKKGRITLSCWCFPEDCHGRVIGSCLVWMVSKMKIEKEV